MSESDLSAATTLRQLGATVKMNRRGKVLVLDFSPIKEQVDDDELCRISRFDRLQQLYLDGTAVTDMSLEHLAGLAKLKTLDLQNTAVTDEGIALLKSLPSLKLLLLNGTQVTRDGIAALRKSMLNTRIVFTG